MVNFKHTINIPIPGADLERKLNLLSGSRGDCWGDVTDGVRKEIQELESSLKMRNVALEKVRCQV